MHSRSSYEAVAKVLREELAEDQIEDVFQVGIVNAFPAENGILIL